VTPPAAAAAAAGGVSGDPLAVNDPGGSVAPTRRLEAPAEGLGGDGEAWVDDRKAPRSIWACRSEITPSLAAPSASCCVLVGCLCVDWLLGVGCVLVCCLCV